MNWIDSICLVGVYGLEDEGLLGGVVENSDSGHLYGWLFH